MSSTAASTVFYVFELLETIFAALSGETTTAALQGTMCTLLRRERDNKIIKAAIETSAKLKSRSSTGAHP
ncbi:hypothetical protein LTR78_004617 [Recurvomyces mirabilis]|uniref:Uncharacterized protein n=1 Tax=Recurvomyces mirabilis TaxID=574656 RepID=A0AAE1C2E7_9PEZI|nr:hypothetical protein LTR78_004617 [Recurvomyces mirabilis]KAK5152889.1 hypothetical protein LTS14_007997 [Recurvomyces mirabilis]